MWHSKADLPSVEVGMDDTVRMGNDSHKLMSLNAYSLIDGTLLESSENFSKNVVIKCIAYVEVAYLGHTRRSYDLSGLCPHSIYH